MARETDDDGNVLNEWDDTPEGFGRIAATTARQVILQRLRDAENEKNYGEFSAREGDIVAGVIQRDARANARGLVVVRMGSETKGSEGVIPSAEQVPGERYEHGDRLRCYVVGVTPRRARAADHVVAHASQPGAQAVLARGARDRRRFGRDRRRGARGGPPLQDRRHVPGARAQRQGRLHRSDGPAGAQRDERAVRREDRHHRLRRGPGPVRGQCAVAGEGGVGVA